MWIQDVRPWGGAPADVQVEGEVITQVCPRDSSAAASPSLGREPAEDVVDGRGRLLLPAFADVHVHLDSTRLGLPFRPHTGGPGVWTMMLNDREHWRDAEVGITERVAHTLELMIARGVTRVRSFAQVDVDCGLERLEAVLAACETHRERAEVQAAGLHPRLPGRRAHRARARDARSG